MVVIIPSHQLQECNGAEPEDKKRTVGNCVNYRGSKNILIFFLNQPKRPQDLF